MTERTERIEIAQYAAAVGLALADLPQAERDELLEDLPSHLAEVSAELEVEGAGATLVDRLGPPSAYAAELRATLGHTGGPSRSASFVNLTAGARLRARRWDAKLGPVIGHDRLSAFLVQLRPAWWVLRGYLAALLITAIWPGSDIGLIPRLEGSFVFGVMLLTGMVIGSIWLGGRAASARLPARLAMGVVTAGLALFGFAMFVGGDGRLMQKPWAVESASMENPYGHIQDVYPIGPDGKVLTGVRLVDGEGNPIMLGWDYCEEGGMTTYYHWSQVMAYEWQVTYPRCDGQPNLPWLETSPQPVPWSSDGPAFTPGMNGPSETPTPDPTAAAPSAQPSETPAPSPSAGG